MKAEDRNSVIFKIAGDVKSNSIPTDLIITVSNGDPVYLYHCERKGWTVTPENLDKEFLTQKIREGAVLLAAENNKFAGKMANENLSYVLSNYKILKNESGYFIVKLK
jgi:hypothetical protein